MVEAELIGLAISPATADLLIGSEQAFIAEGEYDDGHREDLTDESSWSSGDDNIVSISTEGVATAQAKGKVLVTASVDGLSATADVTVHEPVEVVSIEVIPADTTLFLESSRFFTAIAHYSDGSMQGVTDKALWISSNTDVLYQDVYQKGQFHTGQEGKVELSAQLSVNTKGSTSVTVEKLVVTHIIVSPKNFSLPMASKKKYFTEAATSDNGFFSVNQSPDQFYEVSDPSVAYISNNPDDKGQLTGLSEGTVVVMSTFVHEGETYTDQATLTVCVESGC